MTKLRSSYSMWLLALFLALTSLTFTVVPALAAGPVVNTGSDENDGSCIDGDCSLRDAITAALDGETITFAGNYTIYLTSTLTISKHLTIDGSNHAITVSGDTNNNGSPNVLIFSINSSGVATITHLNIVSGTTPPSGAGGGILNNQGTLTVQNSTLSGNSAAYFGGGIMNNKGTVTVQNSTLSGNSAGTGASNTGGGGIMNEQGTVTVQNSTFSGNVAGVNSLGGGILNNGGTVTVQNSTFSGNSAGTGAYTTGGGISNNDGTLTVQNSTFSGNSAGGGGGGIYDQDTLVVTNSTFSGNSAGTGGGIYHGGSGDLLSMSNTIIANSSSGDDCYSDNLVTLNNHNLIETGSRCVPTLRNDPQLGFLADNGGPTWTFALLPGSPALDQGSNAACLSTDQRSVPRPQGGVCDIGAFEVAQPEMAVLGGSPLTLITNGATLPTPTNHTDFGSTVRVGGQMTHTFTISNSGAYTLSVTGLSVSGANAADFTVSGIATPTTASPGSSVIFNVTFAPQVIGTRAATVTIANDDNNENPYEFAIQGTVAQDVYLPLIVKD